MCVLVSFLGINCETEFVCVTVSGALASGATPLVDCLSLIVELHEPLDQQQQGESARRKRDGLKERVT